MKKEGKIKVYSIDLSTEIVLPLAGTEMRAGFPSPAEDYIEGSIDLNKLLVMHPSTTFLARVGGDSMKDFCIEEGNLVVIDRSVEPYTGCIALCVIDGEFTLKQVELHKDFALLLPANENYQPIKVTEDNEFMIWGVLMHSIKSFNKSQKRRKK